MYYTNNITITMDDNLTATKALEVLKSRLEKGFEVDENYRRNPSVRMLNDLYVDGNDIQVPEDSGYYVPEEPEVFIELLKAIATELKEENLWAFISNVCDCSESQIEATYENGTLKTKTTYYPSGYTEFIWCEECGGNVVALEECDPEQTYFCPDCGEELSIEKIREYLPEITTAEFTI
ncbi:MAG: hypothetical protein IJB73_04050 [Firmicutes bacterium]|nr:hypothetical protein [Bacillota bacterium]